MLDDRIKHQARLLAAALIDQHKARIIVPPNQDLPGFWFGGGNIIETPDGDLLTVGRFRNAGDSTTGLAKGERGLELAIFRSGDGGSTFSKVLSFSKSDLDLPGKKVLSIEGAALNRTALGWELYVSTEKDGIPYPAGLESYKKPGTGVWTIELAAAPDLGGLKSAPLRTVASSGDSRFTHIKDPGICITPRGDTVLFFCTHPYSWSSSNSAYRLRPRGSRDFGPPVYDFFPRGHSWDVAVTRLTDILPLPGDLFGPGGTGTAGREAPAPGGTVNLAFYDGAECLRPHEANPMAVKRPRGWSCEEIAGLAVFADGDITSIERVSVDLPFFISPHGTGCCRYIHVCAGKEGIHAVWQQSQTSGAQPLVYNFMSWEEARRVIR